jgi:hypothetical protein
MGQGHSYLECGGIDMRIAFRLLGLTLLILSPTAHAYIDPNAGGLLFQILTPMLIAIAAGWHWIRKAAVRVLRSLTSWPTSRGPK